MARAAGAAAEWRQRCGDLVRDEVRKALVERAQVVLGGVPTVLMDGLVPGCTRVARLVATQLPDDPVGRLDPAVGARIDLGILLEHLQRLGELPLGGDEPAVARQPGLATLAGHGVDAIRLRLRSMVLPELRIGVRAPGQLGRAAQRRAVGEHRQWGGGGEVGRDPDHALGSDAGGSQRRGDRPAQHLEPVLGILQRPLRREPLARGRQHVVDHAVGVLVDRRPQLLTIGDGDDDGAPRQRPEVDADHALRIRHGSTTGSSGRLPRTPVLVHDDLGQLLDRGL
jgi:hypothetical protein